MTGDGTSNDPASIQIRELGDSEIPEVLAVLRGTFDGHLDRDWFHWKHRSGPWGDSPGWVAYDDEGLVGVRLFMPWRFETRNVQFRALRPCDTVTVPRARGRGVFRRLTEFALSRVEGRADFLFNTPNENSRPGYLKMGFVEWAKVKQAVGVVSPKRVRLTEDVKAGESAPLLRTVRTGDFLDWRYRSCPVRDYEVRALADSDRPNGIVFHSRSWRGVKVMVVDECWGGSSQEETLVRAGASMLDTRVVWGSRTIRSSALFAIPRGATVVTRYDLAQPTLPEPSFSMGDVEGVL